MKDQSPLRTSKVVLAGGGGAKVSSFYEAHWTALIVIDVLIGLADSIRLEPPGTAGYGFEFYVERPETREWHQVKYQNAAAGKWSSVALRQERILENFRAKLQADSRASCVFVSAHAAHPFGKLCDHAAESTSLNQFVEEFLSSQDLIEAFIDLHSADWSVEEQIAWEWLSSRLTTRTIDDRTLEDRIWERAAAYFEQPPELVAMALEKLCTTILYQPQGRTEMLQKLATLGVSLRAPSTTNSPLALSSTDFTDAVEGSLVNASFIPRRAVGQVGWLLERRSARPVIVTGVKGCGKSAVVAEVVQNMLERGVIVATIDVQKLNYESSSADVGLALGLSSSPVSALARAAGSRQVVLAIDALDSLAVSRDKPVSLFKAIDEIFRETAAYPNISLLVSCRTQDLETDARLRRLLREPDPASVVHVGPLQAAEIISALISSGHEPRNLRPQQLDLLANLANLKLFTQLPPTDDYPFETDQQLADIYTEWLLSR